jgi:outer membrane biosynthesis protein TonB
MTSISQTAPLLFNWGPPRARSLAIIGFIAASAILHAFGFYVFQIVYPANVALLPPPARVALIAPTSEENRTLLRWIDAEDPALASVTMRPPEARMRALPKIQHIPSYVAEQPRLKPIPPRYANLRAPSSQPPGPVPIARREAGRAIVHTPTRVLFSEDLADLGEAQLPAPRFAASSNEAPESVSFRIGVNASGEIRYCFVVSSSGDPSLDEQARRQLLLARFPQSLAGTAHRHESLTWGMATFEWGNDVAHPPLVSSAASKP